MQYKLFLVLFIKKEKQQQQRQHQPQQKQQQQTKVKNINKTKNRIEKKEISLVKVKQIEASPKECLQHLLQFIYIHPHTDTHTHI